MNRPVPGCAAEGLVDGGVHDSRRFVPVCMQILGHVVGVDAVIRRGWNDAAEFAVLVEGALEVVLVLGDPAGDLPDLPARPVVFVRQHHRACDPVVELLTEQELGVLGGHDFQAAVVGVELLREQVPGVVRAGLEVVEPRVVDVVRVRELRLVVGQAGREGLLRDLVQVVGDLVREPATWIDGVVCDEVAAAGLGLEHACRRDYSPTRGVHGGVFTWQHRGVLRHDGGAAQHPIDVSAWGGVEVVRGPTGGRDARIEVGE